MYSIQRSSKHSRDGETELQTGIIEVGIVDRALTVDEKGEKISEFVDLEYDMVAPVGTGLAQAHSPIKNVVNVTSELFGGTARIQLLVSISLVNRCNGVANVVVAVLDLVVHLISWNTQEQTPRKAAQVCPEIDGLGDLLNGEVVGAKG